MLGCQLVDSEKINLFWLLISEARLGLVTILNHDGGSGCLSLIHPLILVHDGGSGWLLIVQPFDKFHVKTFERYEFHLDDLLNDWFRELFN